MSLMAVTCRVYIQSLGRVGKEGGTGMVIRRCLDVSEAIACAESLKAEGKYDWFRGQSEDWPLLSSLSRVPESGTEEARARLERFYQWVGTTPGLEDLAANIHSVEAVAQHYGIPTHCIDFTTEPGIAGFFASDGRRAGARGESVIYCLNRGDLRRFTLCWSEVSRLEFHQIEVANLWRLEAQHGVFLFCPYLGLEHLYDVDKILFPYTGPLGSPVREEVYPTRKSPLEILLDQYFAHEGVVHGIRGLVAAGFRPIKVGHVDEEAAPLLRLKNALPPHPSWSADSIRSWLNIEQERLGEAQSEIHVGLALESGLDSASIAAGVASQVLKALSDYSGLRQRLVRWPLRDDGLFAGIGWEARYEPVLNRLWDGMRRLPYSDRQVAESLGSCAALAEAGFDLERGGNAHNRRRAASVFGRCIEVNLSAPDGSYSRALVSRASLRSALNDDVSARAPEFGVTLGEEDLYSLIGIIHDPRSLFDFHRLLALFAREIVPTQVLMRGENAVYYSPARLDVLGQP